MPRRRSKKKVKPLKEVQLPTNILQANKIANYGINNEEKIQEDSTTVTKEIVDIKSTVDDEEICKPSTSKAVDSFNSNTAALYDELDSFRQRWRRELEIKQPDVLTKSDLISDSSKPFPNEARSSDKSTKQDNVELNEDEKSSYPDQTYAKAKKLFLTAVELEQDEMHFESIRYYRQAMHLCPDIERQIFREQCEESKKTVEKENLNEELERTGTEFDQIEPRDEHEEEERGVSLFDRICTNWYIDNKAQQHGLCRLAHKQNSVHIRDLPKELIVQILHYVIGEDLDLASLEAFSLVCRSFYLISRDQSLWRSVCYTVWGDSTFDKLTIQNGRLVDRCRVDYRQMFLQRSRVNFDGVYISRTRYIRQGDVGFQDITYRPFHVIHYYRYFRFFPDQRVLILTTNEEPDKIVPIFRHALHSKQFSPELSILEGTYEFINQCGANQINIVAEKDCRAVIASSTNQRRQAQFHWSRQTPITQKFNMKFELKTIKSKPYRNNVLKWLDYTILTRLETGIEETSFDLSPEIFPDLVFFRVKRFNLKLINPLASH